MAANTWSAKNFDFFVDLRNLPGSSHQNDLIKMLIFANTKKLPTMIDPKCHYHHGVANPKLISLRVPASSHQDQLCASCPGQVTLQLVQKPIILCELWNLHKWWSNYYLKMTTKITKKISSTLGHTWYQMFQVQTLKKHIQIHFQKTWGLEFAKSAKTNQKFHIHDTQQGPWEWPPPHLRPYNSATKASPWALRCIFVVKYLHWN